MSLPYANEKSGTSSIPIAARRTPKAHMSKFLAAAFITSAALYCCRNKVANGLEEVFLTPLAPEPKDYCQQVEPYDASKWTSVYDEKGFEAKAAEWLGGSVRIA